MRKVLTLLPLLLLTTASMAEEGGFEGRKAGFLKHIDERISLLQQHKTCVQAAQDQPALRQCRKSMQEKRRAFRDALKKEQGARKGKAPAKDGDDGEE